MRDPGRIPIIINELQQIWKSNPDYRLGQLISVFTKPKEPCHEMFNIEDDEILKGLRHFKNRQRSENIDINSSFWLNYPDVSRIDEKKIDIELIKSFIEVLNSEKNDITITPRNLMKLNNAPVNDKRWMQNHSLRLDVIGKALKALENKGILEEIERGYKIKTWA